MLRYLLPLFYVLLVACCVVATYALLYTKMLSDLCISTPDIQVEHIIGVEFPFDAIDRWYIGGCNADEYPSYQHGTWR
jgi:hypothetical protein